MTVGSNENVDLGTISVGEAELDYPVLFAESYKPVSEVQPIWPMRRSEHTLQVGTVNVAKGRTEPASVGLAQGNGKRHYATVVAPSPPNKFGWLRRKSCDRVKTTETLKFPASIGAQ